MIQIRQWTFARWLRAIVGAALAGYAIFSNDIPSGLFGVWFLYSAFFNAGCCAINSCKIDSVEQN